MVSISASVGRQGVNKPADVAIIKSLLARHTEWIGQAKLPKGDKYNDAVGKAITTFQATAAALKVPDGRVDPNGFTMRRLLLPEIKGPQHMVFTPMCWARPFGGALDYHGAAKKLDCEAAAIEAVARVEVSSRGAWQRSDGRPTILFERHYFRDLTANKYNRSHPDISGPPGGYGLYSEQYPKLYRAAMLNEPAALKSASWGAFQIMGRNHVAAGYATIDGFVSAMLQSESQHLDAFVSFILANKALVKAIKEKNWADFARGYNGPNYAKNNYDTKMADAYAAIVAAQPKKRGKP